MGALARAARDFAEQWHRLAAARAAQLGLASSSRRTWRASSRPCRLFFLLFLRAAVEVLKFLGAFTAAGYDAKDGLAGAVFVLLVLKFLVCLFAMMGSGSRPARRRWIVAQSVAVTWSCLAYTMCWGRVLAMGPTFVDRPIGEAIVDSFANILLFLLLHCPVRIHAVLAVHRGERSATQEYLVVAGFAAITLASMWGFRVWWLDLIVAAFDLH